MKQQDQEKQTRKKYAKKGERGQKMVTFRLDLDLDETLSEQTNKGRFLNDLIRKWKEQRLEHRLRYIPDPDEQPGRREDYEV